MGEPRDLAEYQTDHDLIIELRTLVRVTGVIGALLYLVIRHN